MSGMNVLSLFDGMSCLQIALQRAGIRVNKYFASEIEPQPIQVTQANYPSTVQVGDINGWRDWDIDWASIDLIGGGSPCQGFSSAGGQLAFDDPRSRLFFVYMDILNHVKALNPNVKFLLENVRMKSEYIDVISGLLGVEPIHIDSQLVSAQRRQRVYWANWDFDSPEDKGLKMYDIISGDYYSTRDKSYCLDANYAKGSNFRRYFFMSGRQIVLEKGYTPENLTKETANQIMKQDGNRWRKLLPEECERLQTVPEGYTSGVADGHRYRMLGNGWTVDVISHILKGLKEKENK